MDDELRELLEAVEDSGTVMYFVPPPGRATICVCTWPDGYPGQPKLDPRCPAHKWVRPEQAKRKAALAVPMHRWDDDGGKPTREDHR
jgi:hypothetical protein